jgi:hypothetical protein
MNSVPKRRFLAGLSAGAFLLWAALVVAGDRDLGGPSAAPGEEPRLKVGSTLVIAADSANLMVGSAVVATIPKGQRIVVVEVRDSWVGTYVLVNGQKRAGWIGSADFVPSGGPVKPEPQIYTASESTTVTEPAQSPAKVRVRVPAVSDARDDYFRDYNTGYYTRHETDPNVHVWEPWRR